MRGAPAAAAGRRGARARSLLLLLSDFSSRVVIIQRWALRRGKAPPGRGERVRSVQGVR